MRILKKNQYALISAILLIAIVAGVTASYLWPNVTIPFAVEEPIEILDYSPLNLNLFPGETENITISVYNHAPLNYTVMFDFQLNETAYQSSFISFSDDSYVVPPGEHNLTAWLLVEPDSPPINAALTIGVKRMRPGTTPPSSEADLFEENWDSLESWAVDSGATLAEIAPPGQFHTFGGFAVHYMGFPVQFTIESKLKVDSFGDGYAQIQLYTSHSHRLFRIFADRIEVGSSSAGIDEFSVSTDSDWHLWTVTVDENVQETKVYKDDLYLATFTKATLRNDLTQRLYAGSERTTTCETHWDYLHISTGLSP